MREFIVIRTWQGGSDSRQYPAHLTLAKAVEHAERVATESGTAYVRVIERFSTGRRLVRWTTKGGK